ncbi:MAG: L-serine ammonia-lyase, iron-sulfur-dependent, subunit alpha [Coriobacteriia bacterium]|nr:L-serine ammonia-lyase, iron-sulfur-dependent, subunit alpha [Coriobacteriia bacterium]
MAYGSFAELLAAADENGSLGEAAVARECAESGTARTDIFTRLDVALRVMEDAVAEGLTGTARSRSGLTGGDAARVASRAPGLAGPHFDRAIAAALAVGEVNAAMGRIVAAPTGGASGVLPGVLLAVSERLNAPREKLVLALATAGAIGGVIAARAALSGAAAGCQAEIGSGAAMAAAAAVELAGGTPAQAGHAASLALQGLLGLACDPVGGLVEVPCVARNATGSAVALAAAEMALAGVAFPIPFDEVAAAMGSVGRSLPPSLRETALGGLAVTPTGKRLASRSSPRIDEER